MRDDRLPQQSPLLIALYHDKEVLSIAEKKITPQQKYDRANTTRYQLKLNNKTDKDIIQKLNEVQNKQGYIKQCIRENLQK